MKYSVALVLLSVLAGQVESSSLMDSVHRVVAAKHKSNNYKYHDREHEEEY